MMLEGAGFEVHDLGINNPVENYLAALEEYEPDILGMSALLTTTMPYMKVVIDTLKEKGIRDDYIVLVGGAPLNEDFGKAVGADAYCRDAAVAAETAQALVMARRAAATAWAGRGARLRGRAPPMSRGRNPLLRIRPAQGEVLVLACGAIAREVLAVIELNGWENVTVRCLPAKLHSRPERSRRPSTRSCPSSRAATSACSSRMRTAAPAESSTRCSSDTVSSDCPVITATGS